MRRLSTAEMERALSTIMPKPILYKDIHITESEEFDNLNSAANYDLGRGMLNHERYCLVETINTADSAIEESKVKTSNLDNLLLTCSLMSYKKSKEKNHSGDILFSLPPFSFANSLLLSYHFVLSHLSSNLSHDDSLKFPENKGILIITDNIELLSHIWRTTINNNYLRDFIPVFTLEAGKFKSFNFNSQLSKSRRKKKEQFDGTLPWVTIFRAYRNNLPETLEMLPEVIIIDLLPFRHRKRAKSLIEWARAHSKHIIVIAPSHDKVLNELNEVIVNQIQINRSSILELEKYFNIEEDEKANPITASWSIQTSIPYLKNKNKEILINKSITNENDFVKTLKTINEILIKSKTNNGKLPLSFVRINQIVFKMLNICIPLEWYERAKWSKDEPTLLELINKFSKIPPMDKEEEIIYESFMPHLYQNVIKAYEILKGFKINVRSQLILKTLEENIHKQNLTTLIVSEPIDQEEFKIWLHSLGIFNKSGLTYLNVICQQEWANQQLKEIYLSNENTPNIIIVANAWHQKYISTFYFSGNTKIFMIDAYNEMALLKYQLNSISQAEGQPRLWTTLNSLFETNIFKQNINVNKLFIIKVAEYQVNFDSSKAEKNNQRNDIIISDLFDDQLLIEMLTNDEVYTVVNERTPLTEPQILEDDFITSNNQFTECIRIKTECNEKEKYIYVPSELHLKVKKFNQTDIENISPYELKKNDIWIKVKEKKKRELFEEILKLASNTLLLKWINTNVFEWKSMMKEVRDKYYYPGISNKRIYENIKKDINLNGGKVESYLTIGNWIQGEAGLVRSFNNLEAVANLLGDDHYKKRVKIIYKAMRELWGIHIKLGRSLGKLIDEHVNNNLASKKSDYLQWINLGKDIVIPVDDILNTIDLIKINSIESNCFYNVHPNLTERIFDSKSDEIFRERGLIINEQEH